MNELHKYATFSVDLLGSPNKINNMFSMARARIFYVGPNRNRSIINEGTAMQLANTIPGTPVIGSFNYDLNDFEGHEIEVCAYGFVPLNPNPTWVIAEDNGVSRKYLEVDVVIWDGRFEEAKSIIEEEKSLSMELNPNTMRGSFERMNDKTYYNIEYAEFAGITVLGDDVEPCFEGAKFFSAYSNMVSAYAAYMENVENNEKGGNNVMEDIIEIVEPENTIETVEEVVETVEEAAVEETVVEEVVETESTEEVVEVETPVEVEETETEEPEAEIVETVEEAQEEVAETEFDIAEEDTDKVCPECEQNPCVCKNAANDSDEESEEEAEDSEDNNQENEDDYKCHEEYQALESELNEYKTKYESLLNEYNEALNSLNQYTKKEKLEIINKFSTKLESEELIEKLTSEVDNYSVDEIKNELGRALVEEQMSNDEAESEEADTEVNFSLNINVNDNTVSNSAWDLVKRHKESK